MKIVNIVDEFYPDAGYENNILSKYFVDFGHQYYILTTDYRSKASFFSTGDLERQDAQFMNRTGVKVIRLHAIGKISGRAIWRYKEFQRVIKEITPDVLFFCGNDTFIAMRYILKLREMHYAIVSDSHMLEMASRNPFKKIYRWFYKKYVAPKFIKYNIPVIRLQNDDYVERCLGIPLKQSPWISFGSDMILFHPDKNVCDEFRKKYDIFENAFVVVYAGKLDDAKGGKFFAECIQKRIETDKEIVFVIVGNTSGEYGKEVEDIFANSENRIIRFPTQRYNDLAQFFQSADLAVFPKQCSLSFYDVQACGLPVLSEDNNINVDRCSHENGWNFKTGDIEDFRAKLKTIVDMPKSEYLKYSQNAYKFIQKNYNYEDKAREYEKIIEDTYKAWKGVKN